MIKILNLGCGYTELGLRIDINEKCNPDILADVCKPLPINDTFDIVMAIDVIEHIPNVKGLLINMLNHVSDTGYCIIRTPNALRYEIDFKLFNHWKKINESVYQYLTPCVIKGLINRLNGHIVYQNRGSKFFFNKINIVFTKKHEI